MLEITLYLNRGVKVLNGMKETSPGGQFDESSAWYKRRHYGRSDGWTDRPTNGYTNPLIKMQ